MPKCLIFLLFLASTAQAQDIFSEGFESGTGAAFSFIKADAGVSYVTSDCHTGKYCGSMLLAGGKDQQSIYWAKQVTYAGELVRVGAWWRFPQGFSWDPGGQPWGLEHKMLIINTANDVGRVLVNLRGQGTSPEVAVHFERVDPYGPGQGVSSKSTVRWPTDGAWHHLEIEMQRRSGSANRVRVWLDDQVAVDTTGRVCGSPCAPLRDVQFGAFSNQGALKNQVFYLDDVLISSAARGSTTPPPKPLPKPTPAPDVAKALEALERAQKALEEARQYLQKP